MRKLAILMLFTVSQLSNFSNNNLALAAKATSSVQELPLPKGTSLILTACVAAVMLKLNKTWYGGYTK